MPFALWQIRKRPYIHLPPEVARLYKTLGHCVVLAVIEGSTKYVIDYIDDGQIFESKQKIRKDDVYRTATGRVIIGNMTDEEISGIWQKYGKPSDIEWGEIKSLEDLVNYRDNAEKNAVVSTRMPLKDELVSYGFAAPVRSGMKCVGAIGVAVKIEASKEKAFAEQEEKTIKDLLLKGASLISSRL